MLAPKSSKAYTRGVDIVKPVTTSTLKQRYYTQPHLEPLNFLIGLIHTKGSRHQSK